MRHTAKELKLIMDIMSKNDERSFWFQPLSSAKDDELLGLIVLKVDSDGGSEMNAYSFNELERFIKEKKM